jgi:hypothetical protein
VKTAGILLGRTTIEGWLCGNGFMMLILVVILKIKPLMKYQQMLINLE